MDDTSFFFIGNVPLTLEDLGPAADLPLAQGLQHLVDSGRLGDYPKGTKWFDAFDYRGFALIGPPEDDSDELLCSLYARFKEAEKELTAGLGTVNEPALRQAVTDCMNKYCVAKKLVKA